SSEDARKDRRRKEFAQKLEKELIDKRGDSRHHVETLKALEAAAKQLSSNPGEVPAFVLRVYPLSLERSALLAQHHIEERNSRVTIQMMYDMERERVEEEYKRERERVRERMLEGIEEKRRRAREEKDGEGTVGDASLDSQSRPHITRKLRNKFGTSPPPSPLPAHLSGIVNGSATSAVTGVASNPHSLSVDELPSAFPLPLTAVTLPTSAAGAAGGAMGRRRNKGGGFQAQAFGALGKSGLGLTSAKESEIDADVSEITRGSKRRRAAAG
ncbi:hypothetical protein K488DRAFT_8979, partial [Vararia minispora EC-137]